MEKKYSKVKNVLLYNIFFIVVAIAFYFLIPYALNYPPNSLNAEFTKSIEGGIDYNKLYITIISFSLIFMNAAFIGQIIELDRYKKFIGKKDEKSLKKLETIKKKCFYYPYHAYIFHSFIPTLITAIQMFRNGVEVALIWRMSLLIYTFTALLGNVAYIFAKSSFTEVIVKLENKKRYKGLLNLKEKIFILIFPLILVAVLFMALIADTLISRENGNAIYENYYTQIKLQNFKAAKKSDELIDKLAHIVKRNEEDILFIITEDDIIYTDIKDAQITDFFKKYTFNMASNGQTYGYYTSSDQGTYIMLEIDGQTVAAGVKYHVGAEEARLFIISSSAVLLLVCLVFLWYFAYDISKQVSKVSESLGKIANEDIVDYDQKLVVLSNDEIGDLVVAFNKILDLEKKHSIEIEKNHEVLVEQERLSSLGQMIGGIAHNLKTPIMSIAGASQAIKDLTDEYESSITNEQVTAEDHKEIAKEIHDWNGKIRIYLEYMTEIIDAAKGQAVSMSASTVSEFTIEELVSRVNILMKERLMHRNCSLNIDIRIAKNTLIKGEISALVQVLNNLIMNAIDAYQDRFGNITLRIFEENKKVRIEVEDLAGGISEKVHDKLFKQMITTKGKDGTGLGLYMCYSTIKGKFDGEMFFETKIGKGTKFVILINKI